MQYNFKAARLKSGLSATEVAKRLGVTQAAVSNWDAERKIPSIETLCKLADLYGVTTDYLLNRAGIVDKISCQTERIELGALPAFQGGPAWDPSRGWGIVDAIHHCVHFLEDGVVPFSEISDLYTFPPKYSETFYATQKPLSRNALSNYSRVWVEPISPDSYARQQLRGWYSMNANRVENEYGQFFYLDAYGSKWLAFPENP